ncbi:hypothetical protein NBRC3299_2753 [Acetobacter pasteurianus NBRC 3299]|nr:hypothetical protein NBRC3299_2753 [Acetobacter pasteurianus NBRC 3299]
MNKICVSLISTVITVTPILINGAAKAQNSIPSQIDEIAQMDSQSMTNVKSYKSSNCTMNVTLPNGENVTGECAGYVKAYLKSNTSIVTFLQQDTQMPLSGNEGVSFLIKDDLHGDDIAFNSAKVEGIILGINSNVEEAHGTCLLMQGNIKCDVIKPTNNQYYVKYNISGKNFTVKEFNKQ